MEMHQLRYFIAVARERSFSRAAEKCHVAQPSLSQQIQKLEAELDEPLFIRTRSEAKLTGAGEKLMPRALRILEEAEAARREARESGSLLRGTINLGVLPTIAPYLLPGIIRSFARKFPGIQIVVHEDTTARLVRLAIEHDIDLAIASAPINDERVEARTLFEEELLLALPPDHPLAARSRIRPADIEGQSFIVMREGHCLGDQTLGFCDRGDIHPRISFRSAQLQTLQALVSSGLGLSLVPEMAADERAPNAPAYRSFVQPRPKRAITVFWNRNRPPTRATAELLKQISAHQKKNT